ncbi:MAG TPA: helix-turn-helix transcriptional regulator [Vicinamibacterales bacterium]|nr:helix-turn-helix transcriptional regulator [Vicinamibacterales bacterium]
MHTRHANPPTHPTVDLRVLFATVGGRMAVARKQAGKTQLEAAYALGVSRSQLANMETGESMIALAHLYNAALLYGVDAKTLLP